MKEISTILKGLAKSFAKSLVIGIFLFTAINWLIYIVSAGYESTVREWTFIIKLSLISGFVFGIAWLALRVFILTFNKYVLNRS